MLYFDKDGNPVTCNDVDQEVYDCNGNFAGYLNSGQFCDKSGRPVSKSDGD